MSLRGETLWPRFKEGQNSSYVVSLKKRPRRITQVVETASKSTLLRNQSAQYRVIDIRRFLRKERSLCPRAVWAGKDDTLQKVFAPIRPISDAATDTTQRYVAARVSVASLTQLRQKQNWILCFPVLLLCKTILDGMFVCLTSPTATRGNRSRTSKKTE